MKHIYFITHPNVSLNPDVPVPQWSLSARGLERMRAMLAQPWLSDITSLYTSDEKKAVDGAEILAQHLNFPINVRADLGENDRSATGFLEPEEFEKVADEFFAKPDVSVRGWETARAAQTRIVKAVTQILTEDNTSGSVTIVAHGAVGTLLLCHLAPYPIDRKYDQPGSGGGSYFCFDADSKVLLHGWQPIDPVS